jgi:hypothetical protein
MNFFDWMWKSSKKRDLSRTTKIGDESASTLHSLPVAH